MLFELPSFDHIDATDVEEAVFWLHKYGDKARVVAGGTDLFGLIKDRIVGPGFKIPEVLVNIKTIPDMNRITYNKETGLRIGAAVTLSRLETSDVIKDMFSILSQAARQVGATQIRNMGTIGGNICQRPRCAYFRHPYFVCFKKGGTKCHAITGEHQLYHSIIKSGKCVMAHPSDTAPALVALKATAVIAGPDGVRKVLLHDLFVGPENIRETILKPGEFLVAVEVPDQPAETYQVFLKHRIRQSVDFSLSSVALVARISDDSCEDISIVLGGVAPFPYVASMAAAVAKGRNLNERLISDTAEASVEGARPLPQNHYKVDLTKAIVKRTLMSIIENKKGRLL